MNMAKGKGSRKGETRRQKYSLSEIMAMRELPESGEDLLSVYRTLAKAADQRLVRLKAYSYEKNFKTADQWAYAKAMRDIQAWSGENATRFNTKPPETLWRLEEKIQDIKKFLASPTSTKQGIINVYIQRTNTINEEYGTNFKWQELGDFFESKAWEKAETKYASESGALVIAEVYKHKKEILKAIEDNKKVNIKVPDKMVEELVNEYISEYGNEIKEAFGRLR